MQSCLEVNKSIRWSSRPFWQQETLKQSNIGSDDSQKSRQSKSAVKTILQTKYQRLETDADKGFKWWCKQH